MKKPNISEIKTNDNFEQEIESNEYLFIGSLEIDSINKVHWLTNIYIKNKNIEFKIDTGAETNIISIKTFNDLGLSQNLIIKTNTKLTSYTGDNLKIIGKCNLLCYKNNNKYNIDFYITEDYKQSILGLESCIILNLIKKIDAIKESNVSFENNDKYKKLVSNNTDLFKGIGCLNKPYHIVLKENIQPIIVPTRKVSIPIHKELKATLDQLIKDKIIEKVEGYSEWVNALVIVKKPDGKLRLCLDPKNLNNAIKREYCDFPSVEIITAKMSGAQVFSKLDASNGFYQIPLDKESSNLFVFGTPFGKYKFIRLPFGVISASDVFQD